MPLSVAGGAGARGLLLGLAMALAGACVGALDRRAAGRGPHAGAAAGGRARRRRSSSRSPATACFPTGDSGVRGDGCAHTRRRRHGQRRGARRPARRRRGRRTGWRGSRGRAAAWSSTACERTAPGVYRTTEPLPIDGEWKTMIRLHTGRALSALPIYLPGRPGDPGGGDPRGRDLRARRSAPSRSCSSASARAPRAGCGPRPTAPCWRSRWASSRCSPGACTASRRHPGRRRGASLGSANVSQHFVPHDLRALGVSRVEPLAGLAERLVVVPRGPVLA